MSNIEDWISKRVEEAQKTHSSVTDATATRIKQLLRGQLRERQLRSPELTTTAKVLIVSPQAYDVLKTIPDEDSFIWTRPIYGNFGDRVSESKYLPEIEEWIVHSLKK